MRDEFFRVRCVSAFKLSYDNVVVSRYFVLQITTIYFVHNVEAIAPFVLPISHTVHSNIDINYMSFASVYSVERA